jgi:cyclase
MDADGTESGYDSTLSPRWPPRRGCPSSPRGVRAHGPYDAALRAGASAVLAASIFHFGEYSIAEVKRGAPGGGAVR